MILFSSRAARALPLGAMAALFFAACVHPQGRSPLGDWDASFIRYWPAKEGAPKPRLAVKDLIDMKGEVTTAGSEFLAKHSPPAKEDAACLALIRQRNITIVGKTNLTELAVGVSGINSYFGTPRNPRSHGRRMIPGGSSSGSAVAVAKGLADIALGTDTAGSIRTPAACCGIAGLKTTFGLISLRGVYPIAPNQLDTVGPMARDVAGLVEGMELLEADFASKYHAAESWQHRKIRVGRLYIKGTDPAIEAALDQALTKAGVEIVPLGPAFAERWEQARRDGETVAAANAWISDEKFRHESEVTARTKAVVLLGQLQYNLNYRPALARRETWKEYLQLALKQVDFIALPTLQKLPPSIPIPLGATPAFEAIVLGVQNTVAVNLAGNPALALPVPMQNRHHDVASLQLVGPMRSEAQLLQAGRRIERAIQP